VLDTESPTPYHYLTRSRGGSKTNDLGGMAIAALLAQLPHGSRCYRLAADRDQGRLLVDSVAGFATRTPELRGALKSDAYRVTSLRCTLTGSPGICSTLGDVLEDDDEIDSAKWLPSLRASSCCSMWSSVARGWRTAQ
jgi:hypothetical protein